MNIYVRILKLGLEEMTIKQIIPHCVNAWKFVGFRSNQML
jgi:hypothetical protein